MQLTLRKTFTLLLFLGLFVMTLRPIADPDFWWHLRTGQLILQTGAIPHADPFSFTMNGHPWVAHEWLSELFIYGLFRLGGYGLLIFVFSALITGAFLFVYLRTVKESRPYIAGFILVLGAIATAPTWGVRPQMLSLFFTSFFLYLLDRYRQEERILFLVPLPITTLLWVNLHAGYFLGLAIIGIYIFSELVEILLFELKRDLIAKAPSLKSILILCGALGASILSTLINPNGYHILIYPFVTLTSPSMQQFIQEWFSPDFHQMEWQPLAILILCLLGAGMFGKKTTSPAKIILLLALGYAALRSMRNVPLFALVAIPVLAEHVDALVRIRSEIRTPGRLLRWAASILFLFVLILTGLRFVQVVRDQSTTEAKNFPRAAVDWIVANKPAGNLFNTYGWGGYLIWRLYPDYPVYIDGRADVYGDKFIFNYMATYRAQSDWQAALAARNVRLVLIEPQAALASVLRQSPDWKIEYEDDSSILFTKR